jgi:hypothetical protein
MEMFFIFEIGIDVTFLHTVLIEKPIRVVQKLQFLQAKHDGHAWLGQQPLKTCSISNRVIE